VEESASPRSLAERARPATLPDIFVSFVSSICVLIRGKTEELCAIPKDALRTTAVAMSLERSESERIEDSLKTFLGRVAPEGKSFQNTVRRGFYVKTGGGATLKDGPQQ
jgi:hypothetical protein